ncbi:MAG: hypothetical protein N3C12_00945 [Candidatus Binatia bacterium]|nr:hypothetical protein [Candidatus Binatia bacterium]
MLRQRGVRDERFLLPYTRGDLRWEDYNFPPELLDLWETLAAGDGTIWIGVVSALAAAPAEYWKKRQRARIYQSYRYDYEKEVVTEPIPAAWLHLLRQRPCLPDTRGTPHLPSELYVRTPDTEALLHTEPFVDAELDTPKNRSLLEALGVKTRPAGASRLLERLRALAAAKEVKKFCPTHVTFISRSTPPSHA